MTTLEFHVKVSVPTLLYKTGEQIMLSYRKVRYGYPYRRIKLTKGYHVMVDVEDFERLNISKWHVSGNHGKYYAVNSRMQRMHRLLMKDELRKYAGKCKMFVDHINGNGLDNRKANLRVVTPTQNSWNSKNGMNRGKSKYKGVEWHKHSKRWVAVLSMHGKKIHVGTFTDDKEAARAYDRAAKKYRGKYAVLNFSEE